MKPSKTLLSLLAGTSIVVLAVTHPKGQTGGILQSQTMPSISLTATTNQVASGAGSNITTLSFPASSGAVTLTFPVTTDTIVGRATADTLTNKTLTAPIVDQIISTSAKVLLKGTGTGATQIAMSQTTPPTCSSNCGTSVPAVIGTDSAGIVQMGSGGSPASGFVITFNGTWAAAPSCDIESYKSGMAAGKAPIVVTTTTTTITVTTNGTAPATGDQYAYQCFGVQ